MQIQVVPHNYSKANELATIIRRVIMQHPLIDSSLTGVRNRLCNTIIEVEVKSDCQSFGIDFDIKNNTVKLGFGCWHLVDTQKFEKVLYHEFTHVIDRLNHSFGIDEQSENEAKSRQPQEITKCRFILYEHIWNCYIDGRLETSGRNPCSLQERLNELHGGAKGSGTFTSEVDDIIKDAWNTKNLTFNKIVGLVQKCLQYWRPNEIEET